MQYFYKKSFSALDKNIVAIIIMFVVINYVCFVEVETIYRVLK